MFSKFESEFLKLIISLKKVISTIFHINLLNTTHLYVYKLYITVSVTATGLESTTT